MTNLRQQLVRSCAEEGVKHYPPQAFAADLTRAAAMSIAWDEAAECLARRDHSGFDAAMRIFRNLTPKEGAKA